MLHVTPEGDDEDRPSNTSPQVRSSGRVCVNHRSYCWLCAVGCYVSAMGQTLSLGLFFTLCAMAWNVMVNVSVGWSENLFFLVSCTR